MYSAGYNLPGYLPEMDPAEFTDRDEAIQFLQEELRDSMNDPNEYSDGEVENAIVELLEAAQIGVNFSYFAPDGYVYWLHEE